MQFVRQPGNSITAALGMGQVLHPTFDAGEYRVSLLSHLHTLHINTSTI